ncbi:MAG: hypothetical protein V3T23_02830 [Nitrososphaerales archaeon]
MQLNPGGRLNTDEIIGRDSEISRYWTILQRQGLVLSAERRIGKTHISFKMRDNCRPEFVPFYQDLEGIHTVESFISSIYRTVNDTLSRSSKLKSRLATWSALLPERIGDIELPTTRPSWQSLLGTVFEDLASISDGKKVLMMWDEFPLMIYNIASREGEVVAIELLDQLRSLRQAHPQKIRLLFTGSIGLHIVLRSLRRAGNANDPINDMYAEAVPPMEKGETQQLASELLRGTNVDVDSIPRLAEAIASEVGGFPYYIHHVVDQLHQLRRQIKIDDVVQVIDTLIDSPQDPANFHYYVSRLRTYYDESEKALAFSILDSIAGQEESQNFLQICNLARHQNQSIRAEEIRSILAFSLKIII